MLTLKAQEIKTIKPEVQVTYAQKLGTTPALKYLVPREQTNKEKKVAIKNMTRPPKNFIGRHPSRVKDESKVHTGPDKLRQSSTRKSAASVVEPLVNIEGLFNGFSPQDPTGDVGENYYMQSINITQIGLFDKSDGSLITTFAANTLWNSLGFTSRGDPIILYDQEVERWIVTEFAGQGNNLLVAVSLTGDPMGEYDVYNFSTPNFPDYPKYSVWKNAYTVTTNEQGPGVLHSYFINREELLSGAENVTIQRIGLPGNTNTEAGFYVSTPVDWSGLLAPPDDRDPMFLALNDASWNVGETDDKIEIFSVNVDFDEPSNTLVTQQSLVVSPYDAYPCAATGFGFACVPQLNGSGLDAIPELLMNQIHYRNFGSHESMVMNFITDVTDGENVSGIRWMEMRRTSDEEWSVFQEGTFAPDDNLHRYMGSIAMDGSGNIGLAYNVSGFEDFVGVRFTGRRANDPLGEMTVEEFVAVEGESAINSFERFGDYSHMSIDPFDDKTFWFTTEYAGTNDVRTRIVSFELKKDTFDIGPISLKTILSGSLLPADQQVDIQVENFGFDTIRAFDVGFIFENGMEVRESVNFELFPDSIYNHTFQQTIDVSQIGEYDIKFFTSLAQDQNVLNDTVSAQIINIPELDLSLSSINPIGLVCAESSVIEVNVLSLGTVAIEEATFRATLNGIEIPVENLSSSIEMNQTAILNIEAVDLLEGENIFEIELLSLNGINGDEVDTNNFLTQTFQASINGFIGNVAIMTDQFPNETTWTLTTESGIFVAEGGPYGSQIFTTINESVCMNPDSCYVFTISDVYSDGINGGIDGGYTITNDEGGVLASIMDPAFGSEEVNNFCGLFVCSIDATATTSMTSSPSINDGVIMVEILNGAGPFQYSIDNDNFQNSNLFSGLAEGDYTVTVRGSGNCEFMFETSVNACNLAVAVTVTPETDFETFDGTLMFDITGNFGGTLVSIDGGNTLGTETVFDSLGVGDYEVLVRDSLGCEFTDIVHVGNSVSTEEIIIGDVAKIYPNPTDGVFNIELIGIESAEIFIPVILYNTKGEVIQRSSLAKYDNKYLGVMSLYHYPQGVYYIKVEDKNFDKFIKVLRQ